MNPAHAEPASRRPQAVGERDELKHAAANNDDRVELRPVDVSLENCALPIPRLSKSTSRENDASRSQKLR